MPFLIKCNVLRSRWPASLQACKDLNIWALVQYKEGVNSLMEQAQLVGQAADPLLCLKT